MSRTIQFTKMEGLGNDYVYMDTTKFPVEDPSGLAVKVSDRHFGIGSDGLVLIGASEVADFSMRIFNADGSEAMMCGNASRCIGRYLYEKGLCTKKEIRLETLSGIRILIIHTAEDGSVAAVTVDMGIFETIDAGVVHAYGRRFSGQGISVGNPHYVIFTDEEVQDKADVYGPVIECDPMFPDRTNVEFARIIAPGRFRMRVWERGSGITMACGTGACATAAAAMKAGLTDGKADILMDGGELHIEIDASGRVFMTGPANISFEGTFKI